MSQLQRLAMLQADKCFFCKSKVAKSKQSVEHLFAKSLGGKSEDGNCVMVCKKVNQMFGNLPIKDKVRALLEHNGRFQCPDS